MNRSIELRPLLILAAWAVLLFTIQPLVDTQAKDVRTDARSQRPSLPPKLETAKPQEAINAWTVGLAGGLLEGAHRRGNAHGHGDRPRRAKEIP